MTVIRATIYSRIGAALAEIEPQWEFINWRLDTMGMARFYLPYTDTACTTGNLQLGNRLLIEFDNGLPDWGGVLDVPRRRTATGVTMTAYTGERLLDWARTPKELTFDGDAPGVIFQTLLDSQPALNVGEIYTGGTGRSRSYHYHDLLRSAQDLARLSGNDFYVAPVLSGLTLTFVANWYATRGNDRTSSVLLVEDINAENVTLDEQGPLANQIYCIGEGTTWGDERLVGVDEDADSISLYGARAYAEMQSAVNQDTLDANAEALLALMAYPRDRLSLRAINKAPGVFSAYDVGDIVQVQAFLESAQWAYDEPVRVIAREWTPDGLTRLEVERWWA